VVSHIQIQARHCPPTAQEGRSRQGSAQELPAGIQSTILVQIAGEGDTKAAATFFECSQHDADTLLFLLYTAELAELAARFGVTLHVFADDNQLYLSCKTNEANLSLAALERCVTAFSHWM